MALRKSNVSLPELSAIEPSFLHELLHSIRNLTLQSLEYRRVFFDLAMCYKIVYKRIDVDISDFYV